MKGLNAVFYGKMKALSFSYDDGVTQDRRLIEIFNKYKLKATFNLNSGLLGLENSLSRDGKTVSHNKIRPCEVKELYAGHEIAAHTLEHPLLTQLSEDEIIRQVEEDKKALELLGAQAVRGMAYPCGGLNYDSRVAGIIKEKTSLLYARTTEVNYSFEKQTELFCFKPTVFHRDYKNIERITDEFLKLDADTPALLYIWGHSYEFDFDNSWDYIEALCKKLAGRDDIFYGTNSEVFALI